jgi:transposase-like protein
MAKPAKPKFTPQMTLRQFDELFPSDDACKAYLAARRWPDGVRCPRCGNDKVWTLHARPFHWLCRNCSVDGYRFSVTVETIFEDTKVGLRDWFRVIHMMLTGKKGVAALEVQRVMGFGSYKTAFYMCHRIRAGLLDPNFRKLVGIVETDETFVGGKAKNRHKDKRGGPGRGGMGSGKMPVVGAVERQGNVVARVIDNVRADTLTQFVRETVSDKVSLLVTDEWVGYNRIWDEFPSAVIQHTKGEYVVGAIHTNTIEGFWSLIKRGVMGTFHKVSRKYLPLYVAEFEFRYNNRHNPDIFGEAVGRC